MKKTILISAVTVIAIFAITLTNTVEANYQSVYKSDGRYYVDVMSNLDKYIKNVREMELEGKVMGLSENLDTDLTHTDDSSNNIDVHMEKNTEYGAMVILSASEEYGKQGTGTDRYVNSNYGLKTTTGNVYGVYFDYLNNTNFSDFVSAYAGDINSSIVSINPKYIDRYQSTSSRLDGDGILKWHSTNSDVLIIRASNSYINRSYITLGIFHTNFQIDPSTKVMATRAVAVTGVGF